MPNFIDVMDKLSVMDQQMTSLLSVNDLPTLNRLDEMDKRLDDMQGLLEVMVKDLHMINMILIKGDKK